MKKAALFLILFLAVSCCLCAQAAESGTWGTCPWTLSDSGELVIGAGTGADTGGSSPWDNWCWNIRSVRCDGTVVLPQDSSSLFRFFYNCNAFDLSGFDTSGAFSMNNMFQSCGMAQLDLSSFDTSSANSMLNMFADCRNLNVITTGSAFSFSGSGSGRLASLPTGFWEGSASGVSGYAEDLLLTPRADTWTRTGTGGYWGTCTWDLDESTGCLTIHAGTGEDTGWSSPWSSYSSEILSVVCDGTVVLPSTSSHLFSNLYKCTSMDLAGLDSSNALQMNDMFAYCENLTSVRTGSSFSFSGGGTSRLGMLYSGVWQRLSDGSRFYAEDLLLTPSAGTWTRVSGGGYWGTCAWDLHPDTGCLTIHAGTGEPVERWSKPWENGKVRSVALDGTVVLPQDSRWLFSSMYNCTSMDLSGAVTSGVTDMSGMFSGCDKITSLDLSSFDTSAVTDMRYMFNWCSALTELDLSAFDTGSVVTMTEMFSYCPALTGLDLSSFRCGSLTDMSWMFSGCEALTSLDLSALAASSVENLSYAFYCCEALTSLDLSGVGTACATDMSNMFYGCTSLSTVVTGTQFSFAGSGTDRLGRLPSGIWHGQNSGSADYAENLLLTPQADTWVLAGMGGYWGTCLWDLTDGVITIHAGTGVPVDNDNTQSPWWGVGDAASVVLDGTVVFPADSSYLFSGLPAGSIDLTGADTSAVENMSYMFYNDRNLTQLDLSSFNTAGVTNMMHMFGFCAALESIDLSAFDTSSCNNMYNMFCHCESLRSLDLSGFDTHSVADFGFMFDYCLSLTNLDLHTFDTSAAINMGGMFNECRRLRTLDLTSFDTSNADNMYCMFSDCYVLSAPDLSGFDTSGVIDMTEMFRCCRGFTSLDLSSFDTSNVSSFSNMFYGCSSLTCLDLSGFDVSASHSFHAMFEGCSALESLDLTGWHTSEDVYLSSFLKGCSRLTAVDLSAFTGARSTAHMFEGCASLTSLDLSALDTADCYEMQNMFEGCGALTSVTLGTGFTFTDTNGGTALLPAGTWTAPTGAVLDETTLPAYHRTVTVSCNYVRSTAPSRVWGTCAWDVQNGVLTIQAGTGADVVKGSFPPWFSLAPEITSVHLNGSVVFPGNACNLFYGLTRCASISLSGADTSAVKDFSGMFCGCSSVASLDLNGFDTAAAEDMQSMFQGCASLTSLNLTGFRTPNVSTFMYFLADCSSLTNVDLSGFTASGQCELYGMFAYCYSLQTITLSGTFITSYNNDGWNRLELPEGWWSDGLGTYGDYDTYDLIARNQFKPGLVTLVRGSAALPSNPATVLRLPAGAVTLGEEAFLNMGADVVYIPASVRSIHRTAFDGNPGCVLVLKSGSPLVNVVRSWAGDHRVQVCVED